jgi:hypothetical protein
MGTRVDGGRGEDAFRDHPGKEKRETASTVSRDLPISALCLLCQLQPGPGLAQDCLTPRPQRRFLDPVLAGVSDDRPAFEKKL